MLPDATPRLAAVDLDWEHLRAVDILALLRSFLPKGGAITSVVVYPSGACSACMPCLPACLHAGMHVAACGGWLCGCGWG
jgi:hypothetical protein